MSVSNLLFGRRFGAIFACITLSAFNDNFYKNALVILLTYQVADKLGIDPSVMISMAAAFFILPFFLCSGLAGELADAMPKHKLVRILKVTEVVLMIAAAVALYVQWIYALLAILFFIGVQAAFFGPMKYAILPQLLKREELLVGNGLVEGGTFLSILLGTLVGGALILQPSGVLIVSATLVVISLVGAWAAWFVPVTDVAHPEIRLNYNVFISAWRMVRHACANPALLVPILGISWFWAIGTIYLTQLPVFTKEVIGGNEMVVTLFNGSFTIGVALGSFLCPYIAKFFEARRISQWALAGVFLFGLDLCWMGFHFSRAEADALMGLVPFLKSSLDHVRITLDFLLMAFCGGVFIVPLYTQLQVNSVPIERARTIASNNVMNAMFIATASGISSILFAQKVSVLNVMLLFTLLNVPVIFLLRRMVSGKKLLPH
jgi:acyl-[acyl-carrier-protein]-phospholipid O-acyltransferase/long-chain-fatty-acid--[acyl-carrier-protein] ligase